LIFVCNDELGFEPTEQTEAVSSSENPEKKEELFEKK